MWGKTKDTGPAASKANQSLPDERPVRGESSEADELRRSIVELTKKIEDLEKSRTPDET